MDTVVIRNVARVNMDKLPDGLLAMKDAGRKNLMMRLQIELKAIASTRESKLDIVSFLIGRRVTSTNQLRVGEAVALVGALEEGRRATTS